jgi:3',5'-nucleoside bisphosphate phosphatase
MYFLLELNLCTLNFLFVVTLTISQRFPNQSLAWIVKRVCYPKFMFLGDFHLHSNFSDGELTIPQLVDLMGQNGIGAIAITDHLCEEKTFLGKAARFLAKTLTKSTFQSYLETIHSEAERAWRQYKMLVIPGVEITKNSFSHKNSAHILALGIHEYINPDTPLRNIIQNIKAQGGLAIAAHPVYTGKSEHQTHLLWNQQEELKDQIDLWEVASGPRLFPEVQKSALKKIANSDLHRAENLRSWKTAFSCEKHPEAIRQALLTQNVEFKYFEPAKRSISVNILAQNITKLA